ncbi:MULTISPECIES: TPM domain-containing protein [unclassified Nitrosomonas]|uniref:TPM domain-containing protein n=1 Tax=unclassified Nitrosomonas TaxID=2609265 RepID=UPI00088BAB16|nr:MULTISPECIES: TPM domain-containing protein [unclassified Nitrosomonas]SDH90453.1 TLP18.3, Psb32 and MOLO-1 founding protein of phosphatase [Nitrosomonas sp. Nm132]SDZ03726.1 TLP18.3, Psb32 and MOLO-1 founding protein of phosphatase [Nitrosomonas sp. Nm58]
MSLMRIIRHLFIGQIAVKRALPPASLARIEQAIKQSEMNHDGEILFAVEASLNLVSLLKRQSARERAIDIFSLLRVWDTHHNNGVLVYLLLADHDVEIVADRGIYAKVGHVEWERICHEMEAAFRKRQFEKGVLTAIGAIDDQLKKHFPAELKGRENELPDRPVVL